MTTQSEKAIKCGIRKDKIILDPGIGFGKKTEHNLEILKNLKEFSSLGYYTLLGTSRKKYLEKYLAAIIQLTEFLAHAPPQL